jgi:hypothetical protein
LAPQVYYCYIYLYYCCYIYLYYCLATRRIEALSEDEVPNINLIYLI